MAGEVRLELTTCGFGDRRSSQLSYSPVNQNPHEPLLPRLFVNRVLAFEFAIFFLFQALRSVPLLFHRRVVAAFALGALKNNQFTRHNLT